MSLETLEKIAPKLASEIQDSEILCRFEDMREKKDRHGRDILEFTLVCKNYGKVIIAYSPMYVRELVKRLKDMGISTIREMFENCYRFTKVALATPKQGYTKPYARFLPVEIVPCSELE